MNIALVTHEFPPKTSGGISTYYSALAGLLAAAGHRVTVLTSVPASGSEAATGYDVVRLAASVERRVARLRPLVPKPDRLVLETAAFGLEARDWLSSPAGAGVEVVESVDHGGHSAFLFGDSSPPVLVTCHGAIGQIRHHDGTAELTERDATQAALEWVAVSRADVVGCYSPLNAASWEALLGRKPRFMVAPVILPPAPADDAWSRSTDGEPLEGVVVGRLNSWKGVSELVEAVAICVERGLALKIRWIGRDQSAPGQGIRSMRAHLEHRFPALWGNAFEWTDALTVEETRRAQAEADFAVVPSRWDTFNYTAVEAMSLGTPLVITTGAGASYLCTDGEDALVVEPGSALALAGAIERLRSPELRSSLARRARQTVEREFQESRIVEMRLQGYREAIEQRASRRSQPWVGDPADLLTRSWAQLEDLGASPLRLFRFGARLLVSGRARRRARDFDHPDG